jgi:hypothetical protein
VISVALTDHVNPVPSSNSISKPTLESHILYLHELARGSTEYDSLVLEMADGGYGTYTGMPSGKRKIILNPFVIASDSLPIPTSRRAFSGTMVFLLYRSQSIKDFAPPKNGLKVDASFRYSGSRDPLVWHQHISTLLSYFHLHNLMGAAQDDVRIHMFYSCLEGPARSLMDHNIYSSTRAFHDWSFFQLLVVIEDYFITPYATRAAQ